MGGAGVNVWTVRELTSYIKGVLEGDFSLAGMSVSGELSNVKRAHNGHIWFTLKDEGAQLGAVMFKGDAMRCKLTPSEGMKVVASGRLTVYEPRGNYQMVVSDLRPDGLGDLYAAFLQRKEKLQAEGLFDAARKRAIPRYPTRVGIVTSEQGAALRDMLTTIRRRHPGVSVLLSPAVVQGADAPRSVVAALHRLCLAHAGGTSIDVIIVGRGGGSFEELNAFNDEDVARAIAGCPIPIVSGVGHETDFTIADLVADERAATPTAAAARVTPDREASLEAVSDLRGRAIPGAPRRHRAATAPALARTPARWSSAAPVRPRGASRDRGAQPGEATGGPSRPPRRTPRRPQSPAGPCERLRGLSQRRGGSGDAGRAGVGRSPPRPRAHRRGGAGDGRAGLTARLHGDRGGLRPPGRERKGGETVSGTNDGQSSADLETLTFEEALARLESAVTHLERGDLSLERSMEQFESGIALSRACARKLATAEAKIQKLVDGDNGEIGIAPLASTTSASQEQLPP
ncbi:MAG: exodeoxyribonuclease VII large subunit [Proteobacteria bacterium]|nr:exodeoxyribonuclease VII large subunit [Pseudomonadota bacterium]